MADSQADAVEISIKFSEQQMEIVEKLASDTGKSPAEAVAGALEQFMRKEGSRYSR